MSDTQLKNNQIFWIDTDTIEPNPYQPRKEFDEASLQDLADSIRQYGLLQPVTVTEAGKMDDGRNRYELIAGERRTRASRIAGLPQIPAVIRVGDDDRSRFELAIIENLQREDLNPIDRAKAFLRLAEEFSMTHAQIGKKMGKSRAYVSNSLRLLALPTDIKDALMNHKISEGHARPLMMLEDRPDEQMTLFKEIVYKKMSVRESEKIARKIAHEKVRKEKYKRDPQVAAMEKEFSETLGTRVSIEKGEVGGKIVIDYFSPEDLSDILSILKHDTEAQKDPQAFLERYAQNIGTQRRQGVEPEIQDPIPVVPVPPAPVVEPTPTHEPVSTETTSRILPVNFSTPSSTKQIDDDPEIPIDELEASDIDDMELDIVADPTQEMPQEYYKVFDIPLIKKEQETRIESDGGLYGDFTI